MGEQFDRTSVSNPSIPKADHLRRRLLQGVTAGTRSKSHASWPFGAHIEASVPCELLPRYSPHLGESLSRGNPPYQWIASRWRIAFSGRDFPNLFGAGLRARLGG
jgi:hypothetical protein